MPWYFWTAGSVIVGVAEWRFMFRFLWDGFYTKTDEYGQHPKPRNKGDLLGLSLFWATVLFWATPLVLLIGGCRYVCNDDPEKFARMVAGTTKGMKRQEKQRLARALNEAERELGLGEGR